MVWRYDPVLITSHTPAEWHRRNFADIAARLAGSVDECVVSFAQIYKKTRRRLDQAANTLDFAWNDIDWDEKRALLAELSKIAGENGIQMTICSQPEVLTAGPAAGLAAASCKLH